MGSRGHLAGISGAWQDWWGKPGMGNIWVRLPKAPPPASSVGGLAHTTCHEIPTACGLLDTRNRSRCSPGGPAITLTQMLCMGGTPPSPAPQHATPETRTRERTAHSKPKTRWPSKSPQGPGQWPWLLARNPWAPIRSLPRSKATATWMCLPLHFDVSSSSQQLQDI